MRSPSFLPPGPWHPNVRELGPFAQKGARFLGPAFPTLYTLRRLRGGDLGGALACTEDMLRLAPDQALLWREAGLMNQRLDRIAAALQCLDRSLTSEPEGETARRIRTVVEELRQRLN